MSTGPEDVVQRYFKHLAAGEGREAFALFAPDLRYQVMGSTPISGEVVGVGDFLGKVIRPFTSRLQDGKIDLVPDEFLPSGDHVVVLAHSVAMSTTGKPYNNEYAMVFTVRNG